MENIITRFKLHLERLGYSASTRYMLPRLVQEFIQQQQVHFLDQITPEMIWLYYEYLQQRPHKRRPGGLSESHINHHIYALKTLFKWLESTGELKQNPISALEFPTPRSKPREILDQKEIQLLYGACKNWQERAVLSLYYGCGLRRTEGVNLNIKDVHFRTGLLYVRSGKGAKRRVVPMSAAVRDDVKKYVYTERKAKSGETALLIGCTGNRMSGGSANNLLKTLLKQAKIKRNITLHGLRHSIATHLLESGLDVENVREFLGHSHLESTQIYTRISKNQLRTL